MVKPIKQTFFGEGGLASQDGGLVAVMNWFEQRLGFKPEDALIGLLGTAFMVVYMLGAPVFAVLVLVVAMMELLRRLLSGPGSARGRCRPGR